jgi:hypothetical protein
LKKPYRTDKIKPINQFSISSLYKCNNGETIRLKYSKMQRKRARKKQRQRKRKEKNETLHQSGEREMQKMTFETGCES